MFWLNLGFLNTVEPRFSERQPSGKPRISGIFTDDHFFIKNMQARNFLNFADLTIAESNFVCFSRRKVYFVTSEIIALATP